MVKTAKITDINGVPVILIKFPFSNSTLSQIRTIPGREYHSEIKSWSCPINSKNVQLLTSFGFNMDKELLTYNQKNTLKIPVINGLLGELKNYQKLVIPFIDSCNGRAIIGDDMGLGKTIEAISYLQYYRNERPAIIVTAASLKDNWRSEIKKWMPYPKIQMVQGEKYFDLEGDILIINYDILDFWLDYLIKINPKILITDESQYFKSRTAIRSNCIKVLSSVTPKFIQLSGTLLENRPVEIYNSWKFADPLNCPPFVIYGERYCGGKERDYKGATNLEELHFNLKKIMIRRLKSEVAPELPKRTIQMVPLEIDNRKEYDEAQNDFVQYMKKFKGDYDTMKASSMFIFSKIEILKQLTAKGKQKMVLDWVKVFLSTGNKLVIFVTYLESINYLYRAFEKQSVYMNGSVPSNKRQGLVDQFQNDPKTQLFIGMLDKQAKPAGVGWNLTAASCTATVEFQWTPGVHEQADARVHRLTTIYPVTNYYLPAINTIDERIMSVIDRKTKIVNKVLDNKDIYDDILTNLLLNYKL
jgi:SWI/SNF-related matrix-associated actin-dependent regulator 1 of chromatin subfamily A